MTLHVVHEPPATLPPLVAQLGRALQAADVAYCQWKGHARQQRWATGDGDIDLLIDHASAPAFNEVMGRLGFKPALTSPEEHLPGVESFFGHDPRLAKLLHVHAHYRLVVGRAWSAHYRLPLEQALLASAVDRTPFPVPGPHADLIVLVLRTILGRSLRQELGTKGVRSLDAIQDQLNSLTARCDRSIIHSFLGQHLRSVDPALFDACLVSLQPGSSPWRRARLRRRLARSLSAFVRRPPLTETIRRLARRVVTLDGRVGSAPRGKRLARGGTTIAILGADGSGKSTCTAELYRWLAPNFSVMTAHLGRPPRSIVTLAVGLVLKMRNALWGPFSPGHARSRNDPDGDSSVFPGYLALLRHVCTARDRYLLYRKLRRFATSGGLVLAERYPIAQNRPLVGPCVRAFVDLAPNRRLASLLRRAEERYYRHILAPDAIMVLRVEPEVAVRRKTTEPSLYVRRRARIIWEVDWSGTDVHVVDASRALVDVMAELKTLVWSAL